MSTNNPSPFIPYGAVYFRKSNPPKSEWARDYQIAAEDGMNAFRHWFIWSAIEVAPGVYDWEDYDRQLDLAAKNGLKTIIAEMVAIAPEWAYHKYPHARLETRDGRKIDSSMHVSCAVGGKDGLCLDNDDIKAAAEGFLRALVMRYKDHPSMGGYDIWNECGFPQETCYCPATAEKFRTWLKEKYGDLKNLGDAWHRYSFTRWDEITPPRAVEPYPDTLDWLEFRVDNAYKKMEWRAELIRSLDKVNPITAHGVATSLTRMAKNGTDDWRAAAEVDIYGYTWGSSRHGDEPWKQFHAVDLVRASARGKPFWHAEAYGGPLWMQLNVIGKPRDEGRIAVPEDIRYWNLVSFMAGASGLFYLRWRPLLDGPLFGAFGPYGMDGSRTDRSELSAAVGKWVHAPEQARLWQSRPVQGEVGILTIPETQFFTFAQQGSADFYAQSMQGAYQGFFDHNIQADWVHFDHINEYDFLYLPFPVMLKAETAAKLTAWVAAGGTLVSEGCPAYFGDHGHVGPVQPNFGLDEVFGVREGYVEFTPDLLDDLSFDMGDIPVWGGLFLQAYQPTTGTTVGHYKDGSVAVVDHTYGKGKTRLLGTMAGYGYSIHSDKNSSAFFGALLDFAGKSQYVRCSDARVKTRLHTGDGGTYLWVANPQRVDIPVRLEIHHTWGSISKLLALRGGGASLDGCSIALTVQARDVTVIELKQSSEIS